MVEAIVEVADLHKAYGGVEALAGLNLRVPRGAIYGLLGRNGAGKTTTLKALLGMVRPTSGTIRVHGLAADSADASVAIRRRTSFVSEDRDLYASMSVGEIVRFTSGFYPSWREELALDYLRKFELPADRSVRKLSRGMRTKLAWLLALSAGTELLILDEPTAGLDPAATEELLQLLVARVARDGVTVLLSTHQLADVDQVADHVAIVDRGRTLVDSPLDDLRASYRRVQVVFDGEAPDIEFAARGAVAARRSGRVLTVFVSADADAVAAEARARGAASVEILPVTLKDIFLETVAEERSNGLA
ncbi:MAG TPA: ABC transporter ATP-binding protein [Gammaproteobacteria bacterium]|nr:ABC transporter ATP-binding protein [Gammaproteobacteria bacterium]